MTTTDAEVLVAEKCHDLMARKPIWQWAACASVWARLYVQASVGWKRWPELLGPVRDALSSAMLRCIDPDISPSSEMQIVALESFDIEDDGSAEWQFVVDLIAMISAALDGQDVRVCLQTALRSYLEGMRIVIANNYAEMKGKPISVAEAGKRLVDDREWARAVDFVRAL